MKVLTILLLSVLFVLPGFSPAAAQVATNTPVATQSATPEATAAATEPAVIVVAPTPAVSDVAPATSAPEGYISIWATVLIAVAASIVSGLATGASVARIAGNMLDRINNDPMAIGALETAIDRLGKSAITDDILRAVNLGAQIAAKVTDGIPESAKTPPVGEGLLSGELRRTAQGFVPPVGLENPGDLLPGASVDETGRVTITPEPVQPG